MSPAYYKTITVYFRTRRTTTENLFSQGELFNKVGKSQKKKNGEKDLKNSPSGERGGTIFLEKIAGKGGGTLYEVHGKSIRERKLQGPEKGELFSERKRSGSRVGPQSGGKQPVKVIGGQRDFS